MAEQGDGPDTTSIKPISSLRTKFEQLGKAQDAGQSSPTTPRQASLTGGGFLSITPKPLNQAITSSEAGRETGLKGGGGQRAVTPRGQRSGPAAARPTSMVSMPSSPRPTPSLVVNSPRSPQKALSVDLRSTVAGNPLQPLTPNRTGMGHSPVRGQSKTKGRTMTPASEVRASALNQSTDTAPALSQGDPPVRKTESAGGPPMVNRAAKPKVPAKPPTLLKPSNLAAPDPAADLTDHSASPFGTPPSGEEISPERESAKEPLDRPQRIRNRSNASAVQRVRNDSDASWVQRIRGDSDVSIAERARAGSNASFVEASSLPDNWTPPPTRQAVADQRDQQPKGLSHTPSTPARSRTRTNGHVLDVEEDRPRLPARPELQIRSGRASPPTSRSGRTSPTKIRTLPPMRSVDGLRRTQTVGQDSHPRIPAVKTTTNGGGRSALHLGFDRSVPATQAPAIPAPRRSVDRRREMPPPPLAPVSAGHSRDDEEDTMPANELNDGPTDYPDGTQANRRTPRFKQRPWHIPTDYDTRLFAVCGEYVCTTGYITKVWNVRSGEVLLNMEHRENTKVTAVAFKPSPKIEDEGKRIWLGTNSGEIQEVDIDSGSVIKTKANAHTRREIIRMYRYASELWTLDDGGELCVWAPDHKGMPSLDSQFTNWRTPKGHTFSIASGRRLWIATGKEIRVFQPSAKTDSDFHVLKSPLSQPGTGDVTAGACLSGKQDLIYFGHSDGKVTVYSRKDFSCRAVVNVSVYRISCLAGVGDYLWAGYNTGMAYIYDTSTTPWLVKKDWHAHDKLVCGIIADPSSMWKMGRLNVITLGLDNVLKIWDGILEDDWIEWRMQGREPEFCTFRELTAAVLTWNAGAVKPTHLQYSQEDNNFLRDYVRAREAPDIFVFGFQELVDLEDKKVTAKSFFKSKKKDPAEKEHMSHQYRAWRDHLTKCIDEYMPTDQSYTQLHTTSMVGLFTCIFVKSTERARIQHVHASQIKRGMGGLHGNKGAIIVRLVLDDSSICFVNCHLAAGQTQTLHRNNDIAAILEANTLPQYPLTEGKGAQHSDVFASGGDGSMIMDHEICIINGDLNYRIDTMGRDTVVKHVQQGNLGRLLERDQLLLSRRKNPGFRLRAFQESPIAFAPTYKYNVHTDEYDTSEKRRAPAWCDRILYRGLGKVKLEDYRRWDQVRVSDHRPVSGRLRMRIKTVDPDKREIVWGRCWAEFDGVKQRIARAVQLEYLTNVLGLSRQEAAAKLQSQ